MRYGFVLACVPNYIAMMLTLTESVRVSLLLYILYVPQNVRTKHTVPDNNSSQHPATAAAVTNSQSGIVVAATFAVAMLVWCRLVVEDMCTRCAHAYRRLHAQRWYYGAA